jgi:hypothetical protein
VARAPALSEGRHLVDQRDARRTSGDHLLTQVAALPSTDLALLGLDATTLGLIDPIDLGASAYDNAPAFETLTFKLPKEAADLVNGIIRKFCTAENCKSGSALERIVVKWSQGDTSLPA